MTKYTAVFTHSKKERWWTAVCVEVPGAITQGRTKEKARENLKDAIALILETQREEILREAGADAKVEEVSVGR
jgi:predicted RNase H-like HicB family nuclease